MAIDEIIGIDVPKVIIVPDERLVEPVLELLKRHYDIAHLISCTSKDSKDLSKEVSDYLDPATVHNNWASGEKTVALLFHELDNFEISDIGKIETSFSGGVGDYAAWRKEASKVIYVDSNIQKYQNIDVFDPSKTGLYNPEEGKVVPLYSEEDLILNYGSFLHRNVERNCFSPKKDVLTGEVPLMNTLKYYRELIKFDEKKVHDTLKRDGIDMQNLIDSFYKGIDKALNNFEKDLEMIRENPIMLRISRNGYDHRVALIRMGELDLGDYLNQE